jgi:hypothetical protein
MNTLYGKMHSFYVHESGTFSPFHALKVYRNYIGNVLQVVSINARIWLMSEYKLYVTEQIHSGGIINVIYFILKHHISHCFYQVRIYQDVSLNKHAQFTEIRH